MLVQLVRYNSERNNSAINSTTDQENIVQVASNLLEEENTNTWLQLQEVDSLLLCFIKFCFSPTRLSRMPTSVEMFGLSKHIPNTFQTYRSVCPNIYILASQRVEVTI